MSKDLQVADDPGRQIRQVWLGASGARWPMDWTYDEWIIAFATFTIGGTLITWLIPSGLIVGLLTWWLARKVAHLVNPDAPQKTFRVFCGLVAAACLIISYHPSTWLHPLWFPIAILLSFILPRFAIRSWGGYVDWNRPIAYWLRLPRVVVRGPRRVREEALDPTPLALYGSSTDTGDLVPGQRQVAEQRKELAAVKARQRPIVSTAFGTPPKKVKATITDAPTRHGRISKRQGIPGMKPAKWIYRVDTGLVVFGTEIRLEQRR